MFLITNLKKVPFQTPDYNTINGADAESFAMARVIHACRGEGQWGSRAEDNSKIDLIFSTSHPWCKGERMLVLSQVKSGSSYGSILDSDKGFKLTASAKSAAKRSTHNICVIWVDRDHGRAFWAYVRPGSSQGSQSYGAYHEVSPAMLFDLARCMAQRVANGNAGGRGVMLPNETGNIISRRAFACERYRGISTIQSPLLGSIELTRLGWRHMFRRSRSAKNKNASLNLIPRLPALLQTLPSTSAITSTNFYRKDEFDRRVCEHLLKYDRVLTIRKGESSPRSVTAYIRVIEEISFPTNWCQKVMLSQMVERRVVLKSAYYK